MSNSHLLIVGGLALSISVVAPHHAAAGPFGFDTATKVSPTKTYDYCTDTHSGTFSIMCKSAPKTHPDMETYGVYFVDGIGICGIVGFSKDIKDSGYGSIVQNKTDNIANQIKTKYGQWSDADDILLSGSIWDEPQYWMMSNLKKERFYGYSWELDETINGIDEIRISGLALDTETGFVSTRFHTPLYDKCESAEEEKASDAF